MEDQGVKKRYREPRTVYSFGFSAGLPAAVHRLVISCGNHAAAYLLSSLGEEYVEWKATGTKGEQAATQLLGRIYQYQGDLVVLLTGKVSENAAVPALESLLSSITCPSVVALDSILLSQYTGSPTSTLLYLSNPQAQKSVPPASILGTGNVLKGFSAAALLVCEVRSIPCIAAIALVPDHVLCSSTCRLFESLALYSPSSQGYLRGIAATERSVYSHNVYS